MRLPRWCLDKVNKGFRKGDQFIRTYGVEHDREDDEFYTTEDIGNLRSSRLGWKVRICGDR